VTTVIDGNGNRAELRYDGHMRQDRWTFPSAARAAAYNDATQASALASAGAVNAADYEEYGYDPAGNRTSLRKRDGSVLTFQYDNLNRMIAKLVPERAGLDPIHTRDVHYGYDLRNAQTYARFDSPTGEGVTNAYDGFGRLASSRINMGGVTRTLSYQHDAAGNRTRITHPDGVSFDTVYDGLGRPFYLDNWRIWFAYKYHGAPYAAVRANGVNDLIREVGDAAIPSLARDRFSASARTRPHRDPDLRAGPAAKRRGVAPAAAARSRPHSRCRPSTGCPRRSPARRTGRSCRG
jgi:YD repeat-containing protein